MALQPLYACRSCAVHDAIVFCLCCLARLCLHCDAAVHGATAEAALHPRAPLCDACGDAPAALRCDGTVTLCAACVGRGAPGVTRTGVATYTGCPGPGEMARLISADPPPHPQDLEAWLADRLPRLRLLMQDDHHQLLPPDWDVAMETARLEKMLADTDDTADCCNSTEPAAAAAAAESSSSYANNGSRKQLLSSSPAGSSSCQAAAAAAVPFCSGSTRTPLPPESAADFMQAAAAAAHHAHDKMLQDAMAKKREGRERAKQRYNDKKNKRRFCKHIIYACRKAKADTRKRVKGRFCKGSATD